MPSKYLVFIMNMIIEQMDYLKGYMSRFLVTTVIFAIVSVVCIYLCIINPENPNIVIPTTLAGATVSTVVWLINDYVRFQKETRMLYVSERINCEIKVREYLSEINNYIRQKIDRKALAMNKNPLSQEDYKYIFSKVDDIRSYLCDYPYFCQVYTVSEEFLRAYYYFTRLYFKLDACVMINKKKNVSIDKAYDTLVYRTRLDQNICDIVNENNEVLETSMKLQDIEVNTEKLECEGFIDTSEEDLGFIFETGNIAYYLIPLRQLRDYFPINMGDYSFYKLSMRDRDIYKDII